MSSIISIGHENLTTVMHYVVNKRVREVNRAFRDAYDRVPACVFVDQPDQALTPAQMRALNRTMVLNHYRDEHFDLWGNMLCIEAVLKSARLGSARTTNMGPPTLIPEHFLIKYAVAIPADIWLHINSTRSLSARALANEAVQLRLNSSALTAHKTYHNVKIVFSNAPASCTCQMCTGYDARGLDLDGYDRAHMRNGYNRAGFNVQGVDLRGYNAAGINANGRDIYGYNSAGFKNGINCWGQRVRDLAACRGADAVEQLNSDGYFMCGDNKGRTMDGIDASGFDANNRTLAGYDRMGYDKHGFDRSGRNAQGISRDGYDVFGFDSHGRNRAGFHKSSATFERGEPVEAKRTKIN